MASSTARSRSWRPWTSEQTPILTSSIILAWSNWLAASSDLAADESVETVGGDAVLATGPAGDGLAAAVARVDRVVAGSAIEPVGARPTVEGVVAGATVEAVVAGQADQDVVAAEAGQPVTQREAGEPVGAGGAGLDVGARPLEPWCDRRARRREAAGDVRGGHGAGDRPGSV